MHFERSELHSITCPHLKGSKSGVICAVVEDLVCNIEGVNIKFCMSRRFEVCHVYRCSMKRVNPCLDEILATMASAAVSKGGVESESFWRIPDRGQAMAFACSMAQPGDLVIVCGKGHEQSMCFGTVEYPWDDRDALRAAIRGTPLHTLPTAQN